MAEYIQPRHKFNTRISLKHDTYQNWNVSEIALFPGEAAFGYDKDPETGKISNVRLKIGQYDPVQKRNLLWKELPFVNDIEKIGVDKIDLDDFENAIKDFVDNEAVQSIVNYVKNTTNLQKIVTTDTIPMGEIPWYLDCGNSTFEM